MTQTPDTDSADVPRDPSNYRALMQKVEGVIEHIERAPGTRLDLPSVVDEIIGRLRDELGIFGGRLYESDGDSYQLRARFPNHHEVDEVVRVPRTYPPIELCLMRGSVYMQPGDPGRDEALEQSLGVEEFAAIELGNEQWVLGLSVAPGHDREEILFSLGVLRHSINRRLHLESLTDIYRQAKQIQTSIMPEESPSFHGFDIAGRSDSLESVGGDLFDYIPITDKILGLAIADASGHGLPAALQVRDIHTGLRMGLARDFKIVRTVERLNDIIHHGTLTSRFVSMFYGELEENGTFIGVNAGHNPPFHLKANGEVSLLDQGGPVLGPLPRATYDRSVVRLRPGDMMVLYTDGITEAVAPGLGNAWDREEYGEQRLLEVARANRGKTAAEVIDAIFEDLRQWRGDGAAQDDSTVVVVVYPET